MGVTVSVGGVEGRFLQSWLPAVVLAPETPCGFPASSSKATNVQGPPHPAQHCIWSSEAVTLGASIPCITVGAVHRPLVAGFFFTQVLLKPLATKPLGEPAVFTCGHCDRRRGCLARVRTELPSPGGRPPSGLTFTEQTLSSPSFHTPAATLADTAGLRVSGAQTQGWSPKATGWWLPGPGSLPARVPPEAWLLVWPPGLSDRSHPSNDTHLWRKEMEGRRVCITQLGRLWPGPLGEAPRNSGVYAPLCGTRQLLPSRPAPILPGVKLPAAGLLAGVAGRLVGCPGWCWAPRVSSGRSKTRPPGPATGMCAPCRLILGERSFELLSAKDL